MNIMTINHKYRFTVRPEINMKNHKPSLHEIICLAVSVFCFGALFVFPGIARQAVLKAVLLCGRSVIPTLFPFIVCSRLIIHFYSKIVTTSKKTKSHNRTVTGAVLFMLGLLAGFPAGAILAGKMYEKGSLSKKDAENIAIFSSVPSPSFCILYFGGEIMNDRKFGLIVYLSIVIVSVISLVISVLLSEKQDTVHREITVSAHKNETVPDIICDSCTAVLNICAFITFFMCVGEIVIKLLQISGTDFIYVKPFICGILEFCTGISVLSEYDYGSAAMTGALLLGFGGISAIMQTSDVLVKYGFSCKKLLITKIFSAFAVPIISLLIVICIGPIRDFCITYPLTKYLFIITAAVIIMLILIFMSKITLKNIRKAK